MSWSNYFQFHEVHIIFLPCARLFEYAYLLLDYLNTLLDKTIQIITPTPLSDYRNVFSSDRRDWQIDRILRSFLVGHKKADQQSSKRRFGRLLKDISGGRLTVLWEPLSDGTSIMSGSCGKYIFQIYIFLPKNIHKKSSCCGETRILPLRSAT